jgi:hypothetical protein
LDCGSPLPLSLPAPSDEFVDRKSPIVNLETLTPRDSDPVQIGNRKSEILNGTALTPLREIRVSVVRLPKPRSKIARLPVDIQTNLNTMLAGGCPYADIIRNLNAQGYPGFNKVNLNAWKRTGFQHWLRTRATQPCPETDGTVLVTDTIG